MSETKRRAKTTESQDDQSASPSPHRQTRVTLTKDVSSKYRKIMPRSEGGPADRKSSYSRSRKSEDGSAPPARRRSGPPDRSRDDNRSSGSSFRSRDDNRSGGSSFRSRDDSRPARPFSPRPAGPHRGRGPVGGRPSSGPRRGPAGHGSPRSGFNPGAIRAIVHRELPEATRQIQEIQDLILSTAEAMLTLTEQLGDCHDQLHNKLAALAETHQHLGNDFEPLTEDVIHAKGAVTDIFEKMSFQDLIGQRLLKVDSFLKSLDQVLASSPPSDRDRSDRFNDRPKKERWSDERKAEHAQARKNRASELKGPQAAGGGMDQSAIDSLLDEN